MHERGFTLVELVVGLVVMAVAMTIMSTMLVSQSQDALSPLYRLRASQLGQGVMTNILARAYDENSDHNGGLYRCGEIWQPSNTLQACATTLGRDGDETAAAHQDFNDVDDFITDGFVSLVTYGDVLGDALPSQYSLYEIKIEVEIFNTGDSSMSKKIVVSVKTPSDESIRFSALKGNY